ncbi:vascular cell adhesion protein 1-like [Garra rufa]|uniref:vascular cell adhesion protein 1-like n=1 Tax=Garra rufa TaxID=137080 RepID=UPI003CCE7719
MLQRFFGFVYLSAVSQLVSLTGTQAECPVQLSQKSVVVEYGGSVEVNCTATVQHYGMGWEASEGGVDKTSASVITWSVSDLTEWDIEPFCYINYDKSQAKPCEEKLPVTVYKTPDSVSISIVKHSGPMMEGNQYQLQCDVQDVAPVQYLTVKWYKGQTLLDQTTFTDTIKTPVNEMATLLIRPNRADDGAQYRCEAELDLGAEGPQPPPTVTSQPLSAKVYYKPKHSNSTETIIKDDTVTLDCTVKANPAPTYTWHSEQLKEKSSSPVLLSSKLSPGKYMCTAANSLGKDSKVFILNSTGRPTFWTVLVFFQLLVAVMTGYLNLSQEFSLLNMLQHFLGFVYLSALSQLGSLTGTQAECPVQLNPKSVVVEYGGSVAVTCTASVQHDGMGWEASEGGVDKTSASVITWSVSDLREWEIEPFCYINYDRSQAKPCEEKLPVTVYKTPDSVSISIVNHRGPMMEGNQYELQCDVHDVAPVQYLTVKWYKGQTLLDQTTFTDTIKTPINEMATLLIRPNRADDGAQYRCEAELNLGAEGPQPPPTVTSQPLSAEVHYKPKHSNSTETIIKDDTVTLDCTVKANPAPTYTWHSEHLKEKSSSSVLQSSKLSPGKYTCTAANSLGKDSKVFFVNSTGCRPTFWTVLIFFQLLVALMTVI